MRILTLFLALILGGCAKGKDADSVACTSYSSPYMVTFPDSTDRKSDIALCSDGQYKVTSLDPGDPESFETGEVTVRLHDPQTGTPYYTQFAEQ